MRTLAARVLIFSLAGTVQAQEMASVPWAEFKQVYRESIEREILQAHEETDTAEVPFVYHLASGDYALDISRDRVQGTARITGRVIAGHPEPFPLFGPDLVVASIGGTTGGVLLAGQGNGIQFLPEPGTNGFVVNLSFLPRVQADERYSQIGFAIPSALQNSLALTLTEALSLLEAPGIVDANGVYRFAATRALGVRFGRKDVASTNTLDLSGLAVVDASPVVLDTQDFFISFDENGSMLAVIVMNVPAAAGPHLKLHVIPDVDIWSLTVNDRPRKVYRQADHWIIPVAEDGVSRVRLALLRKSGKLGLQGSLETHLPATGLPSRTLRVGIALPPRVQLLSLEGAVSPAGHADWQTPADFVGKPYFFSRSFYEGDGMKLTVSYKEPVKPENR